ncbi:MAG: hypothetical protein DRG78_03820 [Epsilonproteobacteria bacterium]|nr:MAG: hypothetical protein DRG78_03820 [Campylobacterota bacterium]
MNNNEIASLNNTNIDKALYGGTINNEVTIINQMVDTLKFHFYPNNDLNPNEIEHYNNKIDTLIESKKEAMLVSSDSNDDRYVKTKIKNVSFHVMARTVKSFSVLVQNQDMTIAFKKITDKSNNPVIKLEFRSEYLSRYGYIQCIKEVQQIINSILPDYLIKVSEIHLATDIQGYNFNKLDVDRITCRNRQKTTISNPETSIFGNGTRFSTMSFGKGDFMLRIYDKTYQIQKVPKASYVKHTRWEVNGLYNPNLPVWRIEYQFRRKHLKTLIGKDGLLDGFEVVLNSIPDLWAYACSRFVHFDITAQQCIDIYTQTTLYKGVVIPLQKETIKKRYQRAGISQLWLQISTYNDYSSQNIEKHKEIKKPEVQYVVNAFKGLVSTFVKLNRGNFNKEELATVITTANEEELNKKGFSILQSAKLKAVDYVQDMRKQYFQNGVIVDGFKDYQRELNKNLKDTLSLIEDKKEKDKFFEEVLNRGTLIYNIYDENEDSQDLKEYLGL